MKISLWICKIFNDKHDKCDWNIEKKRYSDEGSMLETLDYTIRIGSTPTFLYFDLYLHSAYAAHFVYLNSRSSLKVILCQNSEGFILFARPRSPLI